MSHYVGDDCPGGHHNDEAAAAADALAAFPLIGDSPNAAPPYDLADLRRLAEWGGNPVMDRRMAATLYGLISRVQSVGVGLGDLGHRLGHRLETLEERDKAITLRAVTPPLPPPAWISANKRPVAGRHLACDSCRGNITTTTNARCSRCLRWYCEDHQDAHTAACWLTVAPPKTKPEVAHWRPIELPACHDCGNRLVNYGHTCSRCNEPVCYHCQPTHAVECWEQES